MEQKRLHALHNALQEPAAQQSHAKCDIDFEILNMQPGLRARQSRDHQGGGRADQGGRHAKDQIRPPEDLSQQQRKRGKGK